MPFNDNIRKNTDPSSVNGFSVIKNPVGRERLSEFDTILQKYQQGKKNLEHRVTENHEYYKLRQWEVMEKDDEDKVEPKSGWLFNAIANKHADAMDNFPAPNILPREKNDKQEAEDLTSIIPVVLDQCEFEKVYSSAWWDKLITGTAVYGVFWDKNKLHGLGDVDIKRIDILNLYWQPGITDIQDSRYVFLCAYADNDILEKSYPELKGKLGEKMYVPAERKHDDYIDTTDKTVVVDVYYKMISEGKTVLHYCKYVGDTVLFSTENDSQLRERGLYDHGMYPFVFDVMFPNMDSPAGFGYIDIGKDAQEYIDRVSQAILKNTLFNAKPRFFVPEGAGFKDEDFANLSKDLVKYSGTKDGIVPIVGSGLGSIYTAVHDAKINELKEVTGNRDVSTGGTTSGVTAASAIAAMQEAGSKLSRDASKAAYRQYRQIILIVIELIRQFYSVARSFRITGKNGGYQFTQFDNSGIVPQAQGEVNDNGTVEEFGVEVGPRLPLFDIEITAQKKSPYSKLSQNELALQLYGQGIFNPGNSDAALALLDMMDFDRKESVIQKVAANGTLMDMLAMEKQRELELATMLDNLTGSKLAQEIMQEMTGGQSPSAPPGETPEVSDGVDEPENTKRARQRTAEMINPT